MSPCTDVPLFLNRSKTPNLRFSKISRAREASRHVEPPNTPMRSGFGRISVSKNGGAMYTINGIDLQSSEYDELKLLVEAHDRRENVEALA